MWFTASPAPADATRTRLVVACADRPAKAWRSTALPRLLAAHS